MDNKFKLKNGLKVNVVNAPASFQIHSNESEGPFDRILYFVFEIEEMMNGLHTTIASNTLIEGGYLFFIYPKKGNKLYTKTIGRDDVFPALQVDSEKYAMNSTIKFTSLQSLDDTFSIIAMKNEPVKQKKTAASQRVGDYAKRVPEIKHLLAELPQIAQLYDSLTPGYQKDWARYVFSAKKEETRSKRKQEMIDILLAGFKTYNLYKQSLK